MWSNTCCSHPLYGQDPNEVDPIKNIEIGQVDGIKYATKRKLLHELGIRENAIPIESIKYITRIQYCAKDEITYGKDAIWGEHEIDYIMFVKVNSDILITPNPEEVCDYKWVNMSVFNDMISPESGLIWSPWFRIVADKLLLTWWADLKKVLETEDYTNYTNIIRFP